MNFLLSMFLFLNVGAANAASFWVNTNEKTVHVAPKPVLEVTSQEIKADTSHWYLVSIELKYDYDSIREQFEEIKARFPDFRLRKVVINKNGNYELSVPILGIQEVIDPSPGVEGPYFTHTAFFAKTDESRIRKVLEDLDSSVSLTGGFVASIPVERLIEKSEISAKVCDLFQSGGKNVFAAIEAFPLVMNEIKKVAKTEKNQKQLLDMILGSCLEITDRHRITSFRELLELPLEVSSGKGGFSVENKETRMESVTVPLEVLKRKAE